MNLLNNIQRGERAREILENELFIESFEVIEQEIIEQWKSAPARDVEGREKLYLLLKLSEKYKSALTRVIETGKLSKQELGHQRSMQERAKEYLGLDESL